MERNEEAVISGALERSVQIDYEEIPVLRQRRRSRANISSVETNAHQEISNDYGEMADSREIRSQIEDILVYPLLPNTFTYSPTTEGDIVEVIHIPFEQTGEVFIDRDFDVVISSLSNTPELQEMQEIMRIDEDIDFDALDRMVTEIPETVSEEGVISKITTTEQQFSSIEEYIEEVNSILKLHFGEDRYDLEKLIFSGSQKTAQLTCSFYYPTINITSEDSSEHVIKDLYLYLNIVLHLSPDGIARYKDVYIYGCKRASLTFGEYLSNYKHSHSNNSWYEPGSFCLGTSTNMAMFVSSCSNTLTLYSRDVIEGLLFMIDEYLSWESVSGTPYRRIWEIYREVDNFLNRDVEDDSENVFTTTEYSGGALTLLEFILSEDLENFKNLFYIEDKKLKIKKLRDLELYISNIYIQNRGMLDYMDLTHLINTYDLDEDHECFEEDLAEFTKLKDLFVEVDKNTFKPKAINKSSVYEKKVRDFNSRAANNTFTFKGIPITPRLIDLETIESLIKPDNSETTLIPQSQLINSILDKVKIMIS